MSAQTLPPRVDGLYLNTIDPHVEWFIQQIAPAGDGTSRFMGEEIVFEPNSSLEREIAAALYRRFHAGMTAEPASEENPLLYHDTEFEDRLLAATEYEERIHEAPIVEDFPQFGGLAVLLQGIRTFVPYERVTARRGSAAWIRLRTTALRLSVGFMFYTSRFGGGSGHGQLLRLYRHALNGDEAIAAWRALLTWTESRKARLRAKILSRSFDYPRNDALVIYLPTESWHFAGELAQLLESSNPTATTSPFAYRLAPGVAMAWEPADPATHRQALQLSFGEHRTMIIAAGIMAGGGDHDRTRREIKHRLLAANVDPLQVHQNLDSPILTPSIGGRMG